MSQRNEFATRQVGWPEERQRLLAIRIEVFVKEQGVPLELEEDIGDPGARHFLATRMGDRAVGTARLGDSGQIGRMAVLKPYRNRGVGELLLKNLVEVAKQAGMNHLFLHAQITAIGFYARYGFVPRGNTFSEAGIDHQRMEYSTCGQQIDNTHPGTG